MRLRERRILITGAASGIGRATAQVFAAEGARLALLDINREGLNTVARDLSALAVPVDVRQPQAVNAAVATAGDALGGLDGVVNAAGINVKYPIAGTSDEDWSNVISLNLGGTFFVCRAAAPHLSKADAATIVNIASGAALMPPGPNLTAYAASKGGVVSMTKALAKELAPKVRVNVICPGNTRTPLTERVLGALSEADRVKAIAAYALNRLAEPEEIARAILFLTSHESSYVTGVAFPVDGGRTFH